MNEKIYQVGQRVKYLNIIDDSPDYGTIVFIEHDLNLGFDWIYIKSENDKMNQYPDLKFTGLYWMMCPSIDDRLMYDID